MHVIILIVAYYWQETFFKAVQQSIIVDHDEEELEYDSDGYPVIPDHAKVYFLLVVIMCVTWAIRWLIHCPKSTMMK